MMCRLAWLLTLGLLTLGVLGVGQGCTGAQAQEPLLLGLDDLPPSAGVRVGGWQSVGWDDDPWHPYPASRELVIAHDLGRRPVEVTVYIAFVASGEGAALAAGDLAQIVDVTETDITIRNQTRQDYFCRVVAR